MYKLRLLRCFTNVFFNLIFVCTSLLAQQPQTNDVSNTQSIYAVNAKYVNGVAPGYWPTNGGGLTLQLSSGTAICGNPPMGVNYTGGTLSMTANQTNYIYLNPASSCAPSSNTTGFVAGYIPIAKVVTNATTITTITDIRSQQQGSIPLVDRGGQLYDIRDYGADGVTDDGAAINSAMAACPAYTYTGLPATPGGCIVFVPQGNWTITTPPNMKGAIHLKGAGRERTRLKLAAGVNLSVIQVGTNATETGTSVATVGFPEISDLTIDGNASGQTSTSYGIHLGTVARIFIHDVRIVNCRSHALKADNGSLTAPADQAAGVFAFDNLSILAAQSGFGNDAESKPPSGIYLEGTSDGIISRIDYNDLNSANYISDAAIYLRDAGEIHIVHNLLSSMLYGVKIEGSANNHKIIGNFINSGSIGIYMIGTNTNSLSTIAANTISLNFQPAGGNTTAGIELLGTETYDGLDISGNSISVSANASGNPDAIAIASNATITNSSATGNITRVVSGTGKEYNDSGNLLPRIQGNAVRLISGAIQTTPNVVTSSVGTSAFDLTKSNIQQTTLTENTTATLSNIKSGQTVEFIVIQNATAAKTFSWPAIVHNGMTVSVTLSSINIQECTVSNNGTDLYCSAGATGLTGGTP